MLRLYGAEGLDLGAPLAVRFSVEHFVNRVGSSIDCGSRHRARCPVIHGLYCCGASCGAAFWRCLAENVAATMVYGLEQTYYGNGVVCGVKHIANRATATFVRKAQYMQTYGAWVPDSRH